MKKTAFALIAVSALGLVACQGGNKGANASHNAGAATNEAVADVGSAEAATNSALDAEAANMANQAGTNGSNAAGDAATNGAAATGTNKQ
jgi:hypothetical protein